MANMFSGNSEKKIPKDLKSCYKTDGITQNLWLWCERLEKWGKILFIILIIVGIIDTIIAGVDSYLFIEEIGAETLEDIREASTELGVEIPTVFEALLNNLLGWALYSFLEYCAYHVLALLVGSLATIVQHTKITADIALYNSAKLEGIVENSSENLEMNDIDEEKTDEVEADEEKEVLYKEAQIKMQRGSGFNTARFYIEAEELLMKLDGYKDSVSLLQECKNKINELKKTE